MKRRDFIIGLGAGASMALTRDLLFPLRAWAADSTGSPAKYFVLIKMQGGWDVTLGLDPKVHMNGSTQEDMFIEYRPEQIITKGSISLAPAASPLTPYMDRLAIINGIAMAPFDNGHIANLGYIVTGNGQGKAPDLPIEIAFSERQGLMGVIVDSSISTLDREVVTSTFQNALDLSNAVPLETLRRYLDKLKGHGKFSEASIGLANDPVTRKALIAELLTNKSRLDSMGTNSSRLLEKNAIVLACAFCAGAAFQSEFNIFPGLDTHTGHEKLHMASQLKGWEDVASIFKVFQETPSPSGIGSLFDQTTFMVVSEFARTPALNTGKGKDHNPLTNSVLLAGRGVRTGVFGQSHLLQRSETQLGTPSHTALPLNLVTGEVAQNRQQAEAAGFQYIAPENIARTVAEIMGVDWRRFKSVPKDLAYLAPVVKT
jgi:uncharacterized protein (DUF1501 family)